MSSNFVLGMSKVLGWGHGTRVRGWGDLDVTDLLSVARVGGTARHLRLLPGSPLEPETGRGEAFTHLLCNLELG